MWDREIGDFGKDLAISQKWCKVRLILPTFCRELCKNGWTDRFVVWIVDWVGRRKHKLNHIFAKLRQLLSWEGTLAQPGEYDWIVPMRRRCGLMSNYFDHLLSFLLNFGALFYHWNEWSYTLVKFGLRIPLTITPKWAHVRDDATPFCEWVITVIFDKRHKTETYLQWNTRPSRKSNGANINDLEWPSRSRQLFEPFQPSKYRKIRRILAEIWLHGNEKGTCIYGCNKCLIDADGFLTVTGTHAVKC